jgi:hypothetical protein
VHQSWYPEILGHRSRPRYGPQCHEPRSHQAHSSLQGRPMQVQCSGRCEASSGPSWCRLRLIFVAVQSWTRLVDHLLLHTAGISSEEKIGHPAPSLIGVGHASTSLFSKFGGSFPRHVVGLQTTVFISAEYLKCARLTYRLAIVTAKCNVPFVELMSWMALSIWPLFARTRNLDEAVSGPPSVHFLRFDSSFEQVSPHFFTDSERPRRWITGRAGEPSTASDANSKR